MNNNNKQPSAAANSAHNLLIRSHVGLSFFAMDLIALAGWGGRLGASRRGRLDAPPRGESQRAADAGRRPPTFGEKRARERHAEQSRGRPLTTAEKMERARAAPRRARILVADDVGVDAKSDECERLALKLYKRAFGSETHKARDQGEDTRSGFIAAKKIVASTVLEFQKFSMRSAFSVARQLPWIVMAWSWDTTPEKARRQACVDEGAGVMRTFSGSSEHLIQTGSIKFPEPGGIVAEELLALPMVVGSTASGAMLAGLQERWAQIGVHPINMARQATLLILLLTVDAAGSNLKLIHFLHATLPRNVLLISVLCAHHQLQRTTVAVDDVIHVSGPMFSLSKLMCVDMYFQSLCERAAELVRSDPLVIYGQQPPAACRHRARLAIRLCLGVDIDKDLNEYEDNARRMLAERVRWCTWRLAIASADALLLRRWLL